MLERATKLKAGDVKITGANPLLVVPFTARQDAAILQFISFIVTELSGLFHIDSLQNILVVGKLFVVAENLL